MQPRSYRKQLLVVNTLESRPVSLGKPKRLDELLNYRLARLLALSSAPGIRLFEGRYGISRREWSLVGLVALHGPISPSQLAELAQLERSHVSRAITDLAAKGLLARSSVANDRRRAKVAITSSGRALYEEVFPQVALINQAVLAPLTASQLQAFDEALHILTCSAEDLVRSKPVAAKAARHLGSRRAGGLLAPGTQATPERRLARRGERSR